MYAIITLISNRVNLIVTEYSNIDWMSKEVEDHKGLIEFEFSSKSEVNAFYINDNKHRVVKVVDLDEARHRLLVDKKMYVILHKIV